MNAAKMPAGVLSKRGASRLAQKHKCAKQHRNGSEGKTIKGEALHDVPPCSRQGELLNGPLP